MMRALADSAMGRSLRTVEPGVARAMSFDLKLSFISAAKIGETLRATARHAGRRTMVTECRVEGRGGRLIGLQSPRKGIAQPPHDQITIRGAREHNLKNVTSRSLAIGWYIHRPFGLGQVVRFASTHPGQRRYVESLSAYARQFLGQMEKPDVDVIEAAGDFDRPEGHLDTFGLPIATSSI